MIILRFMWIMIQVIGWAFCCVFIVPPWLLLRHVIPNLAVMLWDKMKGNK